jgi:N-acetyl-gamma-glutamyl-phosphate reductase
VKSIGIVGASGYTGVELLRLCAQHPELEVAFATGDSKAGMAVSDLYPSLAAAYPGMKFEEWRPELLDGVEGLFVALPHGKSQEIMGEILDSGVNVVDLGADFRLPDADTYKRWYSESHTRPDLLAQFAYGLPELNRAGIKSTHAVANPGCYPTAGSLALLSMRSRESPAPVDRPRTTRPSVRWMKT